MDVPLFAGSAGIFARLERESAKTVRLKPSTSR
jgi:hypothetical protein